MLVDSERRGRRRRRSAHDGQRDVSLPVPHARLGRELVRGRRRAGRQGDDLVGHAGSLADEEYGRHRARVQARGRARDLHARFRLLRHQRRRHRLVRRRSPVAGGWQAGACPADAEGRDGLGELRAPLPDQPARGRRRERHDCRLGLRGVDRATRRPPRLPESWQRGDRLAGGLQPRRVHTTVAGAGADHAARQRRKHGAVVRRRASAGPTRAARAS